MLIDAGHQMAGPPEDDTEDDTRAGTEDGTDDDTWEVRGMASPVTESLWNDPDHGPLPLLLLALTMVTGLVDAVSILRLGRVFVANMTGNVVFVGFALAGAPGFSLSASLFALAGFLIGAGIAGFLIARTAPDRGVLLLRGALGELVLVTVALLVAWSSAPQLGPPARDAIAALLATGMGVQNAVARRLAVPDLTTTVLTMTLTGIAADRRTHARRPTSGRRVLAVVTMLVGAIVGAELVLHVRTTAALGLAVGILATVTVGARLGVRQAGAWRSA